jgi:hypothetical protein
MATTWICEAGMCSVQKTQKSGRGFGPIAAATKINGGVFVILVNGT